MSLGSRNGPQLTASRDDNKEAKSRPYRSIVDGIKEVLSSAEQKVDSQSAFGAAILATKADSKRKSQSYLQESFEKELSKVKRLQDYQEASSLFSNNTDNDSTIKFISILDKINENQMKKNRFYSEIIKDGDGEAKNEAINESETIENFNILSIEENSPLPPAKHQLSRSSNRDSLGTAEQNQNMMNQNWRFAEQNGIMKVAGPAYLSTQNIDHLLEMHQPNQHEIIFECSKEWTVNQTPDMRDKESMPPHLALHFERLRAAGETGDITPDQKGDMGDSSRVFKLNCQKDLFGNKR